MIYSVDNGDRGTVTVDGVEVMAVSCDPEKGVATVIARNDDGSVKANDGYIVYAAVQGKVEFTPREEAST